MCASQQPSLVRSWRLPHKNTQAMETNLDAIHIRYTQGRQHPPPIRHAPPPHPPRIPPRSAPPTHHHINLLHHAPTLRRQVGHHAHRFGQSRSRQRPRAADRVAAPTAATSADIPTSKHPTGSGGQQPAAAEAVTRQRAGHGVVGEGRQGRLGRDRRVEGERNAGGVGGGGGATGTKCWGEGNAAASRSGRPGDHCEWKRNAPSLPPQKQVRGGARLVVWWVMMTRGRDRECLF